MELSGLIFVALALVWAVVLIPKALRHHDEVARSRAVEDVSDGVRVVARRTSTASVGPALPVEPPAAARSPEPAVTRSGRRTGRTPARAAARRRRRVLILLVLVGIAVGTAAWLGYLQPWAPAIPVALTLGFLVVARISVRRDRARRARQAAARRRTPETRAAEVTAAESEAVVVVAPESVVTPVAENEATRDDAVLSVVSGLDDTSAYSLQLATSESPTTEEGSVWDPLPVTLPTYVSKPRATRSVRTIDLGSPDVSSSGHDAAASALVAEAATSTTVTASGSEPLDGDQRAVSS